MIYETLDDFITELITHPDEMYINNQGTECAVYNTETGAVLFLDGDFSGSEEECDAELRRCLQQMALERGGMRGPRPPKRYHWKK